MARQKKNQKVDTIRHSSGVSVDLMLDPNTLIFSAQISEDQVFKDGSAQEVRAKVSKYLDSNSKIEWVPAIQVSEQKPFCASDYAFIGIEVERFYIGRDSDGQLRKLRWCDYDQKFGVGQTEIGRINSSSKFYGMNGEIKFPSSEKSGEGQTHHVAYEADVWIALNQIREAIHSLKSKLRETLNSEEGMKRLAKFGAKALLALPEKSMNCLLHPERPATDSLNVPCAPGGKVHICAECKADPDIAAKTFEKYRGQARSLFKTV